jgi:hypothetical protein
VKPFVTPSSEAIARVRALSDRVLDAEEFRAALATPLVENEEEETRALIRWLRRRHPTPADRLAYARRAYRRRTKVQGRALGSDQRTPQFKT